MAAQELISTVEDCTGYESEGEEDGQLLLVEVGVVGQEGFKAEVTLREL